MKERGGKEEKKRKRKGNGKIEEKNRNWKGNGIYENGKVEKRVGK